MVPVLLLGVTLSQALPAQPDADEATVEARLQSVRKQIAELTAAQREVAEQREQAGRSLREVDQQIGALSREQGETVVRIAEGENRLQQLEANRAEVASGLAKQREALAVQLRAVHALGRHQQLKLLLAQDQVGRVGRVLTYHDYLQRDRIDRIGNLLEDMRDLAEATAAVDSQRERLTGLFERQGEQIEAVAEGREAREALLAELDARHADQAARLTALGRDEAALLALLESLRDVFADIPDQLDGQQPLADLRGQLAAPLQGRLLAGFGSKLADGRPSRGWLIEAEEGAEVQAIGHGRVAFSDWMQGYGLLTIIDHGDGYMSLYAHNQALLREVGDWVDSGEALAQAGRSGGAQSPALYFELRRDGKPVDPVVWIRR